MTYLLGAHVLPAAAEWLERRFGDRMREDLAACEGRLDPQLVRTVRMALRELEAAAQGWAAAEVADGTSGLPRLPRAEVAEVAEAPSVAAFPSRHGVSPGWTPAQVARAVGLTTRQIRNICSEGIQLDATKHGRGSWSIEAQSAQDFIEARRPA